MSDAIERRRSLGELEDVVSRGLATFIEVGGALLEIRDARAYRDAGYADFDTYCRERWGWGGRYVDRQIQAARVAKELGPIGPIPSTESQARELARIPDPVERAEVWREVTADDGPVTAARIREIVESRAAPAFEWTSTPLPAVPPAPDVALMRRALELSGADDAIAQSTLRTHFRGAVFEFRAALNRWSPAEVASAVREDPLTRDHVAALLADCMDWLAGLEREMAQRPVLRVVAKEVSSGD